MADELSSERFEELVSNEKLFEDELYYRPVPLPVWFEIIRRYPDRRWDLAYNKRVPIEVLEVLALCDDWRVVSMVACKRKLTPALFSLLAKDEDEDEGIRGAISGNRSAPDDILELLSNDPIDHIREAAQHHLAERMAKRTAKQ